jgi:hypothetical protein
MDPSMKFGELFDGKETHVQKDIRELKKVGEKTNEPAQPDVPSKRMTGLKNEINYQDREGKIKE